MFRESSHAGSVISIRFATENANLRFFVVE